MKGVTGLLNATSDYPRPRDYPRRTPALLKAPALPAFGPGVSWGGRSPAVFAVLTSLKRALNDPGDVPLAYRSVMPVVPSTKALRISPDGDLKVRALGWTAQLANGEVLTRRRRS